MIINVAAPRHTAAGIGVFIVNDGNWCIGYVHGPRQTHKSFVGLYRPEDGERAKQHLTRRCLLHADDILSELA